MERLLVFTAIALASSTTGCSKNEHNLYPVSGKVLYNGLPAAGAAVFFYRQGANPLEEQMVMGVGRDDGRFELVCGPWGKGAPPGEYDVAVEWKPIIGQRGGNPLRAPDRLNGRYSELNHLRLRATLEAKPNELPAFELTE
jgi:hypothetical protein